MAPVTFSNISISNVPISNVLISTVSIWRALCYLKARYTADRCSEVAAALTYMSLFALVPLLTLLYAIGSAVPAFQGVEQQLQQFLLNNLVPESSSEVVDYLNQFSVQARNLTGFGIGILFVTAVLMLKNVERAFNRIWRNSENRTLLTSLLLYWAVLSLAPIMMGLGIATRAYLYAAATVLSDFDILGLSQVLLTLLPLLLSIFGLTFLYTAVPNSQVPLKHALAGAVVAALAFSLARLLFTTLIANSSYTFVYGAFAAVPIFLIWLYVTWNIVLIGALVAHSLSAYQNNEQAHRPLIIKALHLLQQLFTAHQTGRSLSELDILRNRSSSCGALDGESWRYLRDLFLRENLIAQDSQRRYILTRDLRTLSLLQLQNMLDPNYMPLPNPTEGDHWYLSALAAMQKANNYREQTLTNSIDELFTQPRTLPDA
jgi:membrane protein